MTQIQRQMAPVEFHGANCVKTGDESVRKVSGFTLVELMIVVAIVGVLVGIAYPAYMGSIQKSRRADAMTELSDLATRLQRCYTTNTTFNSVEGICITKDSVTATDGIKSSEKFYVIKGSSFSKTAYKLTATPIAGTSQASDKQCQTFTLTQSGEKAAFDADNNNSTESCWR